MRAAYALTDLMIDALRRLDALPRALRWVLFFPAGIVCMLIVQGVLGAIYDAAGLSTSPEGMGGVSRAGLVSFTWALGVTLFPAVLSPRPWVVGVVMFALVLLVGVEPLYTMITTPYLRARLPSRAVVVAVWISAHALGGAVGLYLIRRFAARTNGVDAAPANSPGGLCLTKSFSWALSMPSARAAWRPCPIFARWSLDTANKDCPRATAWVWNSLRACEKQS